MLTVARQDRRQRLIPGIVDAQGTPLPMPHDQQSWLDGWYPQVMLHRIRARRATEGSDRASLLARAAHTALCRQPGGDGTLYLLNTFGWILEPRNAGEDKRLPFITWPRQAELLDELAAALATPPPAASANLAVIKSRDVGGTWMDVAHKCTQWLFSPLWFAMVISSDFSLAADWDDPKSYFYKVKFLLQSLPEWLLPAGFAGIHVRSPHAKEGILINPDTGSTLTASTTTPDAGRGNRLAEATLEEAGTLDEFDAIYNNLMHVTDHTIVISSAHVRHGMGLYNLVHGKEGYTPPRVFSFRWSDVPGRDEDWYRGKQSTMKAEEFAREVDIDWLAGSGDVAFPAIQRVEPGHFPYVPGWQTYISLDDGYDQDTAISGWQTDLDKGRLRCVFAYANSKKPIHYYGHLLTGQLPYGYEWGEEERALAAWLRERAVYNHAIFYGDRHGDNTDLSSGKSPFAVLAEEFGIGVITSPGPESNNLKYRLDLVNEHLHLLDFDAEHGAPRVLEALKVSRHPRRRDSAQAVTEVKGVIHHGTESHFRTTVDYLLVNIRWTFQGRQSAPPPSRVGLGGFDPHRAGSGRRFRQPEEARTLWTR
jgi:hypothetical protein